MKVARRSNVNRRSFRAYLLKWNSNTEKDARPQYLRRGRSHRSHGSGSVDSSKPTELSVAPAPSARARALIRNGVRSTASTRLEGRGERSHVQICRGFTVEQWSALRADLDAGDVKA
jgi:hypothetical protein